MFLDDMDIQLLLGLQKICNQRNIKIPWDEIGQLIAPTITAGAVIQHLAKLRLRREQAGLPVPAPLKRGGGFSGPATSHQTVGNKRGRPSKSTTSVPNMSNDDDEEEFDVDRASDPEESFGETRSKRAKGGVNSKLSEKNHGEYKGKDVADSKFKPKTKTRGKARTVKKAKEIGIAKTAESEARGQAKEGRIIKEESPDAPEVTAEERSARRTSIDYAKLAGEDSEGSYDPNETYTGAGAACFRLEKVETDSEDGETNVKDASDDETVSDNEDKVDYAEDDDKTEEINHGSENDEVEKEENEGNADDMKIKQSVVLHLGQSVGAIGLLRNLENEPATGQAHSGDGTTAMDVGYGQPTMNQYQTGLQTYNKPGNTYLHANNNLNLDSSTYSSNSAHQFPMNHEQHAFEGSADVGDTAFTGTSHVQDMYPSQTSYGPAQYVPQSALDTTSGFHLTNGGFGSSASGGSYGQPQQVLAAPTTLGYETMQQNFLSMTNPQYVSSHHTTQAPASNGRGFIAQGAMSSIALPPAHDMARQMHMMPATVGSESYHQNALHPISTINNFTPIQQALHFPTNQAPTGMQGSYLPSTPVPSNGGFQDSSIVNSGLSTNFVSQSPAYSHASLSYHTTAPNTPRFGGNAAGSAYQNSNGSYPNTPFGGDVVNFVGAQNVAESNNQHFAQSHGPVDEANNPNTLLGGITAPLRTGNDPVLGNFSSGEETDMSGLDPGDNQFLGAQRLGKFLADNPYDGSHDWNGHGV